jgi:hypothetical protein
VSAFEREVEGTRPVFVLAKKMEDMNFRRDVETA